MAEITALEPGNAYDGGITDQVFSSIVASSTVRLTGREIFIFKTDDDLTGTVVISSVASSKTKRTGDISLVIASGAGKHAIWDSVKDGFLDGATGMITIDALANGEMMVIRPQS